MKKYVCIGGFIISKADGQRHYINPYRLAELYKVNPDECYFAENDVSLLLRSLRLEELTILRPDYKGDYQLAPNHKEER